MNTDLQIKEHKVYEYEQFKEGQSTVIQDLPEELLISIFFELNITFHKTNINNTHKNVKDLTLVSQDILGLEEKAWHQLCKKHFQPQLETTTTINGRTRIIRANKTLNEQIEKVHRGEKFADTWKKSYAIMHSYNGIHLTQSCIQS